MVTARLFNTATACTLDTVGFFVILTLGFLSATWTHSLASLSLTVLTLVDSSNSALLFDWEKT